MYPISSEAKALFEAEQRQILRITGTDKNGAAINITDADIVLGGFNIDRYSCNGEKLEVGTAIAAEMTLKLNNGDGKYDGVVFEGTELFVEIGIADWTQDAPTVNWIPCGYFTSYEQPRSLSTITIHALDRMVRFDVLPAWQIPWTDNNDNQIATGGGDVIDFYTGIEFPKAVSDIISSICGRCGVPLVQDLSGLENSDYIITGLPSIQQEITCRNIIQWCAGIMGTCAFIDWNGQLVFKWYDSVVYTSAPSNRYASDLYENDITITGVQYTNTQNATVVVGADDYTLDLTGNYLVATGIAEILPNINAVLQGFTYRPFSATAINAPYLWPMDIIVFEDKDGGNHSCAITNVNFGLNGSTKLKGNGKTNQANDGVLNSGITKEQAFLVEQAVEVTRQLDESLNQESIFNRLTNNGETQGLFLNNGKLYLNASYIQAGTLTADFIRGGTLTLGGWNNRYGALRIVDSYENVIGEWNENGLKASGELSSTYKNYEIKFSGNAFWMYEGGNLNATLAWGENGAGLYSNPEDGSVSLSAVKLHYDDPGEIDVEPNVGEIVGGAWVRCNTDGYVELVGKIITQEAANYLPVETISGTIEYVREVGSGGMVYTGRIEVVNGLIVGYS